MTIKNNLIQTAAAKVSPTSFGYNLEFSLTG